MKWFTQQLHPSSCLQGRLPGHVFLSYSYLEIWNLMSIQDFRAFLEYGSLRIHPSPYQNTPVKYLLAL